ncbi:MAG: elongation factor P [Chlamydiae bacterium SM23_39]|nr:MAG: elongation factor P [Chlamydiae bacterium SM23_39]
MVQVTANELKAGMKVEINDEPYLIISNQFVKPGKGSAFNRIKLKNILTNRVIDKTYKSTEKLAFADVEETLMRLIYTENESAIFMDDKTFDQITVPFSILKDKIIWLKEDTLYEILLYKGKIIEIIPPIFMELKIIKTEPGLRGDTSGKVLKPALLETNAKIQVPLFINEGDIIKVDTRTSQYVSRV